ncbi:MAG TPA: T9SS type A sorting domain-containing protein [Bacteroidia bacterium]|nr:T9SS type A sorting domain-containing protein [Bacteroidia bacterium]
MNLYQKKLPHLINHKLIPYEKTYTHCFSGTVWLYKNNTYTASITVSCASTSIVSNTNQIQQTSIFPNPAQNNFTIQTNKTDNQNLQVFDVSGKLILAQTINGTTSIDVGTIPEGVYILRLTNNQGIVNKLLTIVK